MNADPFASFGNDRRRAILTAAAQLFAREGYAAVSMRDLAAALGITPAALYYHFPDKNALYDEVLLFTFKESSNALVETLREPADDRKVLRRLIALIAKNLYHDETLCLLFRRELLDGDERRLALLTEKLAQPPFDALRELAGRLAPHHDAALAATSIFALLLGHIELIPIHSRLSGGRDDDNTLEKLIDHVHGIFLAAFAVPPA